MESPVFPILPFNFLHQEKQDVILMRKKSTSSQRLLINKTKMAVIVLIALEHTDTEEFAAELGSRGNQAIPCL
jgi:hypothetical protein